VPAAGLEDSDLTAHVAAGNDARSANKTRSNVRQDTSVQVGGDQNIELLWAGDALHASVVDNHVVGFDCGVILSYLLHGVPEETIRQLHDIGLVDTGYLLAVVGKGKGKGKLSNTLRLCPGDDLQRLDHAGYGLMLKTGVLSLGVLTDDAEVDILVARLEAGNVLDQHDRCVDIELLTQSDVEGRVAGALDRGVENT